MQSYSKTKPRTKLMIDAINKVFGQVFFKYWGDQLLVHDKLLHSFTARCSTEWPLRYTDESEKMIK